MYQITNCKQVHKYQMTFNTDELSKKRENSVFFYVASSCNRNLHTRDRIMARNDAARCDALNQRCNRYTKAVFPRVWWGETQSRQKQGKCIHVSALGSPSEIDLCRYFIFEGFLLHWLHATSYLTKLQNFLENRKEKNEKCYTYVSLLFSKKLYNFVT